MMILDENKEIVLSSGYSEYEISADHDLKLVFHAKENCDVFLHIVKAENIEINTVAKDHCKVNVLFWNDSESDIVADEVYDVYEGAEVTAAYAEINQKETLRNVSMNLFDRECSATLASATLCNSKKSYNMKVVNHAPHTYGNINNYAVVLKEGRLMIDAIGKIVNGAYGSQSHQTSRALSFEEGQRATILPELLIDENDVQASHAMSMGRIDEEQLYYLMSRGLSVQQCTSLISAGYLLPITNTLENETLKEKLKEALERKIGELC